MSLTVRPIDVWPGEFTRHRRVSAFKVTYTDTLTLLRREVRALAALAKAPDIVAQLAVASDQIRLDGDLRASVRPIHPGVIISFESRHGPLRYHTDRFTDGYGRVGWHDNLRAIALGLEALRKIDRYGITSDGEQYRGWQAIGDGSTPPATSMTIEEAAELLVVAANVDMLVSDVVADGHLASGLWRKAARLHHPDVGGDPDKFRRLTTARNLLTGR